MAAHTSPRVTDPPLRSRPSRWRVAGLVVLTGALVAPALVVLVLLITLFGSGCFGPCEGTPPSTVGDTLWLVGVAVVLALLPVWAGVAYARGRRWLAAVPVVLAVLTLTWTSGVV